MFYHLEFTTVEVFPEVMLRGQDLAAGEVFKIV